MFLLFLCLRLSIWCLAALFPCDQLADDKFAPHIVPSNFQIIKKRWCFFQCSLSYTIVPLLGFLLAAYKSLSQLHLESEKEMPK